jgi:hypothetical protein
MLAALGIGPQLGRSRSDNPAAQSAAARERAPEKEKEIYEHSAANLLEEFFDTDPDQIPEGKPWSAGDHPSVCPQADCRADRKIWPQDDPRRKYKVDFLIATLPEPASPPLRHEFDTQLDAIETAAGRAGYNLATFDLPWLDETRDRSGEFRFGRTIDIAPDDSEKENGDQKPRLTFKHSKKRETGSERASDAMPFRGLTLKPNRDDETRSDRDAGVMLFSGADKHLLVVFIVGETPMRGVNKTVLRDALDQVAWIAGWKPGKPTNTSRRYLQDAASEFSRSHEVKIIGPAFSGSAVSIRNALDEWSYSIPPNERPLIRIRPDR